MASPTVHGVVVVTGGTAGVGRAVVNEFARSGYDVAVLARGRAGLAGAVDDVERAGRAGLSVSTDVADATAVEQAAETVEHELGEIGVWINVAFVGSLAYFWDTEPDEFRRITEVTYYGQVNGTRTALRRMRSRDRGVIVNVGSAMAHRSIPLQSAYCGAKHAVKGFSESVMTELASEGSNVELCMVQLPGLNTPQFTWNLNKMPKHPLPVPPIFQPELPGRAVRFLVEHPRRNMWVGFSTVYTVLGERLAPKLLDKYLARRAISGQQTDDGGPRRGVNLLEAADETADAGPHGPFDEQARTRDPQLWASMYRRGLLYGGGAAALVALLGIARRRG